VNGNFTAVEASVDDNAADIAVNTTDIASNALGIAANAAAASNPATIKWLANSTPVGSFLYAARLGEVYDAEMLTFEDYYVAFNTSNGQIEGKQSYLFYLAADCQGQPHIYSTDVPWWTTTTKGQNWAGSMTQGVVLRSPYDGDTTRLYYAAPGTAFVVEGTFLSNVSEANGGCSNGVSTLTAVPVNPNDPAITGVAGEYFDLPISIGHR
jgi:hypothetical protein